MRVDESWVSGKMPSLSQPRSPNLPTVEGERQHWQWLMPVMFQPSTEATQTAPTGDRPSTSSSAIALVFFFEAIMLGRFMGLANLIRAGVLA